MCPKKIQYKYVKVDNDNELEQQEEIAVIDLEETTMKRKFLTPRCLWTSGFTGLLLACYYVPSITLTFYQRWFLQTFKLPGITVLVHMVVKYTLALLIKITLMRKQMNSVNPDVSWTEYLKVVIPVGFFSGIDIAFSNWGLELITVTLYTMTKSTTIIFILFFSILFKLEKMTWSLCAIVLMIAVGLMLVTYKASEFNLLGFILLLLASLSSGLRWSTVQMLLQKVNMGMKNPIDMIFHMQPWMFLSVLPGTLVMEGPKVIALFSGLNYDTFMLLFMKLMLGSVLAFFMEFSEFVLVTYTSSLTLSIACVIKDLFMVLIAVAYGDQMSVINVIGLLICMSGVAYHVVHKINTTSVRTNRPQFESETVDLKESLLDHEEQLQVSSESEDEKSDTQVLFDILNTHDR